MVEGEEEEKLPDCSPMHFEWAALSLLLAYNQFWYASAYRSLCGGPLADPGSKQWQWDYSTFDGFSIGGERHYGWEPLRITWTLTLPKWGRERALKNCPFLFLTSTSAMGKQSGEVANGHWDSLSVDSERSLESVWWKSFTAYWWLRTQAKLWTSQLGVLESELVARTLECSNPTDLVTRLARFELLAGCLCTKLASRYYPMAPFQSCRFRCVTWAKNHQINHRV